MDRIAYGNKQSIEQDEYEALCKRCGKCCGADTAEPCANLAKDTGGKFYCTSYHSRLGLQRTVTGKIFTCVEIRDVLTKGLPHEGCSYSR